MLHWSCLLAARRAGPVLWGHAKGVNAVALAPDGSCLLSGGVDGTLRLWSARGSGRALGRFNHGGAVTAVAFSPDGERYVSAGSDGQVKVWQSGSTDARAAWVPWPVNAVSFVFDGGTVLAAANNGVLALLDVSRMDVETGGK